MNTVTDNLYNYCSGAACNQGSYADVKDNGFSVSGKYKGFSAGYSSLADIKDNGSASVGYKGFKVGGSWADNSTVCDSQGNCIVRDNLKDNSHTVSNVYGSTVSISDNLFADNNSHSATNISHSNVSVRDNLKDNSHTVSNVYGSTVSISDNLIFEDNYRAKRYLDIPCNGTVEVCESLRRQQLARASFKIPICNGAQKFGCKIRDPLPISNPQVRVMLYVKRSRCGHEPNYADSKDNFSLNGSFKGFSAGYSSLADNSTVCDSRGNCIVRDALYTKGPCITDAEWAAGVHAGSYADVRGQNNSNMRQMYGY